MDKMGDRLKNNFENRTRYYLEPRSYFVIRVDGKSFHTYTKNLQKPFDLDFMKDMNKTAQFLCENIQGAILAYVQSDEISILFSDLKSEKSELYFKGNVQKIASVTASMASAYFNKIRPSDKLAFFDSRVFRVDDINEVLNVFLWRQFDCIKNSVQMYARHFLGHKICQNKNCEELVILLNEQGFNWISVSSDFKVGRIVFKQETLVPEQTLVKNKKEYKVESFLKKEWKIEPAFDFKNEKDKLLLLIKKELSD